MIIDLSKRIHTLLFTPITPKFDHSYTKSMFLLHLIFSTVTLNQFYFTTDLFNCYSKLILFSRLIFLTVTLNYFIPTAVFSNCYTKSILFILLSDSLNCYSKSIYCSAWFVQLLHIFFFKLHTIIVLIFKLNNFLHPF